MEYVKLDGFLGRQLSKVINKAVRNKMGFEPNININSFSFETDEADRKVKVTMSLDMDTSKFEFLIGGLTE